MIKTDVVLKSGGYIAEFRSDLGGNCYRLFHEPTKSEILRTPENEEKLFSEIFLFGNAILFPPNRIKGAEFTFEGRKYTFPLNEPKTNSHIHGELYKTPFKITEITESKVTFEYEAKCGEYLSFPHAFKIERSYSLSEAGLTERIEVTNYSDLNMPFMLAFHTTFNMPFTEGACKENGYMQVAVGKEHIRDEKYLPTLEYIGGREREIKLNTGEYKIADSALSAFYENFDNKSYVSDKESGLKIVYEASDEYKYRMLWRKDEASFVVIEPQTCAIDCFHLEAPAEEKGLIVIPPKKTVALETKFYIQQ